MSRSVSGWLAAAVILGLGTPVLAEDGKQAAEPPADCNASKGENCTLPKTAIRSGQIGPPGGPAPISPSGREKDADMRITAPSLTIEQIFPGGQLQGLSMERE